MSFLVYDIIELYKQQFGSRPVVGKVPEHKDENKYAIKNPSNKSGVVTEFALPTKDTLAATTNTGGLLLSKDSTGIDIWLPTWLSDLTQDVGEQGRLFIPYCTVRISGSQSVVKTPMVEQKGTVKELYSVDDYKISIKGFFIDKANRTFPEADIQALKTMNEMGRAFKLENALTDIFLIDKGMDVEEQRRVVMTSFDLPEQSGGKISLRPFAMTLESDNVFTLIAE